jgi:hypothetical protein
MCKNYILTFGLPYLLLALIRYKKLYNNLINFFGLDYTYFFIFQLINNKLWIHIMFLFLVSIKS